MNISENKKQEIYKAYNEDYMKLFNDIDNLMNMCNIKAHGYYEGVDIFTFNSNDDYNLLSKTCIELLPCGDNSYSELYLLLFKWRYDPVFYINNKDFNDIFQLKKDMIEVACRYFNKEDLSALNIALKHIINIITSYGEEEQLDNYFIETFSNYEGVNDLVLFLRANKYDYNDVSTKLVEWRRQVKNKMLEK